MQTSLFIFKNANIWFEISKTFNDQTLFGHHLVCNRVKCMINELENVQLLGRERTCKPQHFDPTFHPRWKRNFYRILNTSGSDTVCSGTGIVVLRNYDCGTGFVICSANYTLQILQNPIQGRKER